MQLSLLVIEFLHIVTDVPASERMCSVEPVPLGEGGLGEHLACRVRFGAGYSPCPKLSAD